MAHPAPEPGPTTGIDYLRLVDEAHRAEQARDIAPLRFVDLGASADGAGHPEEAR